MIPWLMVWEFLKSTILEVIANRKMLCSSGELNFTVSDAANYLIAKTSLSPDAVNDD